MGKARVGIDIGSRFLHMSVWSGTELKDLVSEALPEGLVRDGRVVSAAAMGDFLKEKKKEHKIRVREASLVLHSAECYCRRVETPAMTAAQLKVNLPYEFRDFVSDDKDKYYYDYAVLPAAPASEEEPAPPEEGEEERAPAAPSLDLMAAAVPRAAISEYREILKRGGFDLKVAIPEEIAYMNVLSGAEGGSGRQCVLDLGHTSIRLHMLDGAVYHSGRSLDFGCGAMDDIVAGAMNVDPFIAATYRESNYQNCQELPSCVDLYNSISLEVMKAINFFNFSSQGQPLERVCCCGGGAAIATLVKTLRESLPLPVVGCADLLSAYGSPRHGGGPQEEAMVSLCATGAAMQGR